MHNPNNNNQGNINTYISFFTAPNIFSEPAQLYFETTVRKEEKSTISLSTLYWETFTKQDIFDANESKLKEIFKNYIASLKGYFDTSDVPDLSNHNAISNWVSAIVHQKYLILINKAIEEDNSHIGYTHKRLCIAVNELLGIATKVASDLHSIFNAVNPGITHIPSLPFAHDPNNFFFECRVCTDQDKIAIPTDSYWSKFTKQALLGADETQLKATLAAYLHSIQDFASLTITQALRPISIKKILEDIISVTYKQYLLASKNLKSQVGYIHTNLSKQTNLLLMKTNKMIRDLECIIEALEPVLAKKFTADSFIKINNIKELDELIYEYVFTGPVFDDLVTDDHYNYFCYSEKTAQLLASEKLENIDILIEYAMLVAYSTLVESQCSTTDTYLIKDFKELAKQDEEQIKKEAAKFADVLKTIKQHRLSLMRSINNNNNESSSMTGTYAYLKKIKHERYLDVKEALDNIFPAQFKPESFSAIVELDQLDKLIHDFIMYFVAEPYDKHHLLFYPNTTATELIQAEKGEIEDILEQPIHDSYLALVERRCNEINTAKTVIIYSIEALNEDFKIYEDEVNLYSLQFINNLTAMKEHQLKILELEDVPDLDENPAFSAGLGNSK